MSRAVLVPPDFNPVPSASRTVSLEITELGASELDRRGALGIPVSGTGEPPKILGLRPGRACPRWFRRQARRQAALPEADGRLRVAVGIGDGKTADAASGRDAAAAYARAAANDAELVYLIDPAAGLDPAVAAQVAVEGSCSPATPTTRSRQERPGTPVTPSITLLTEPGCSATRWRRRRQARPDACPRPRCWRVTSANTPPAHLTAARMAEVASELGGRAGLGVEVFDRDELVRLGCGGLIGVNGGSADEPRMVRLTYRRAGESAPPHLALVAKGIMYDSGGLSLKPADAVHATMKNDMSGAAATLSAMLALGELGCRATVTGYLMCTDNVPSGTALKLGDVITIHGGTTVEVLNADAEGRLVMADALVLAAEQRPDAIVDIATLTGACMRALGTRVAGVMGSSQPLIDQVLRSADATTLSKPWQLPLEHAYRRELDSDVADLTNIGGPNAGAITAALFLEEFTRGVPWAHIDIAGLAQVDKPALWCTAGCSGFGARLLADLAVGFGPA